MARDSVQDQEDLRHRSSVRRGAITEKKYLPLDKILINTSALLKPSACSEMNGRGSKGCGRGEEGMGMGGSEDVCLSFHTLSAFSHKSYRLGKIPLKKIEAFKIYILGQSWLIPNYILAGVGWAGVRPGETGWGTQNPHSCLAGGWAGAPTTGS